MAESEMSNVGDGDAIMVKRPVRNRLLPLLERSLRFSLFGIPAMMFSLWGGQIVLLDNLEGKYNWLSSVNLTYIIGELYFVLAALAPPIWTSFAVALGGGFIGLVVAFVMATFALVGATYSRHASFFAFVTSVALIAPMRQGFISREKKLPQATLMTSLAATYVGIALYMSLLVFVDPGYSTTVTLSLDNTVQPCFIPSSFPHASPGTCTAGSLSSSGTCQITCDSGYRTTTAASTCTDGVFTAQQCLQQSIANCTVVAPVNGQITGGPSPSCAPTLQPGANCNFKCNNGGAATASCSTTGVLTKTTCDASSPVPNVPSVNTAAQGIDFCDLAKCGFSLLDDFIGLTGKCYVPSLSTAQLTVPGLTGLGTCTSTTLSDGQTCSYAYSGKTCLPSACVNGVFTVGTGCYADCTVVAPLYASLAGGPSPSCAPTLQPGTNCNFKCSNGGAATASCSTTGVLTKTECDPSVSQQCRVASLSAAQQTVPGLTGLGTCTSSTLNSGQTCAYAYTGNSCLPSTCVNGNFTVGPCKANTNGLTNKLCALAPQLTNSLSSSFRSLSNTARSSQAVSQLSSLSTSIEQFTGQPLSRTTSACNTNTSNPQLSNLVSNVCALAPELSSVSSDLSSLSGLTSVASLLDQLTSGAEEQLFSDLCSPEITLQLRDCGEVQSLLEKSCSSNTCCSQNPNSQQCKLTTQFCNALNPFPCINNINNNGEGNLNIYFQLCGTELSIRVQGGSWIIPTMWTQSATGILGVYQAFFVCFFVGMGLFGASLLLWPRTGTYQLLEEISMIMEYEVAAALPSPSDGCNGDKRLKKCAEGLDQAEQVAWTAKTGAFEPGASPHGVLCVKVVPAVFDSVQNWLVSLRALHRLFVSEGSAFSTQFEQSDSMQCLMRLVGQVNLEASGLLTKVRSGCPTSGDAPAAALLLEKSVEIDEAWKEVEKQHHDTIAEHGLLAQQMYPLHQALVVAPKAVIVACSDLATPPSKGKGFALHLAALIGPFLIPIPIMILNAVRMLLFWKWPVTGEHRFWANRDFQHAVQWTVGIAILVAPSVYNEKIRAWGGLTSYVGDTGISFDLGLASDGASWWVLGFFVTIQRTVEGTAHKCAMRIIGTFLGLFFAFCALWAVDCADVAVCEKEDWKVYFLSFWIAFWCIPAVIFGAAKNPLLGFDRSFGYGFQSSTYTMAIVIVSAWTASDFDGNRLVGLRLFGQLVGCCVAILVSYFIFPSWAGNDVGLAISAAFNECQEGLESCLASVGSGKMQCDVEKKVKAHMAEATQLMAEAQELVADSLLFAELNDDENPSPVSVFKHSIFKVDKDLKPLTEACFEVIRMSAALCELVLDSHEESEDPPKSKDPVRCDDSQQLKFCKNILALYELAGMRLRAGKRGTGGVTTMQKTKFERVLGAVHSMLEIEHPDAAVNRRWADIMYLMKAVQKQMKYIIETDLVDDDDDHSAIQDNPLKDEEQTGPLKHDEEKGDAIPDAAVQI